MSYLDQHLQQYGFAVMTMCCAVWAYAQLPPPPPPPEQDINLNREQMSQQMPDSTLKQADYRAQTVHMTSAQLQQNPLLLEQALNTALVSRQMEAVRLLLPLYEGLHQKDELLVLYGRAVLADADGHYAAAIADYRTLIAHRPDLSPVRLALAAALFTDGQLEASREQFAKVRSDPALPDTAAQMVAYYEQALAQQQTWSVDVSLRYLADNNINNAANLPPLQLNHACGQPQIQGVCEITYPQSESAHGLGYDFAVRKDTSLANHWFLRLEARGSGKFYWDNHSYDDLQLRVSAGPLWRNAKHEWSVQPYYAWRWYGGESYSYTGGVRGQYAKTLDRNWRVLAALDWGRQRHHQRQNLDGYTLSTSTTVLYRPSARHTFGVGVDIGFESARDRSDAHDYRGVRGIWAYEWPWHFSTHIQGGLVMREYRAENFFGSHRQDRQWYANMAVWNRAWHWRGLTPRLVIQYQHTDSNQDFFNSRKQHWYLDLSKTF